MTPDEAIKAYESVPSDIRALIDWFITAAQKRHYNEGFRDGQRGLPSTELSEVELR